MRSNLCMHSLLRYVYPLHSLVFPSRVADLTEFVVCLQGAPSQKYFLLVNLVQKRSINSLVEELKRGKYLSRERIIRDSEWSDYVQ